MKIISLQPKETKPVIEQIKDQSQDGLVLCFAGVGSAWARKNANTSLIIAKKGVTVCVDLGTTVPQSMEQMGVDWLNFDHYHFTHSHADHVGAVEELALKCRYITKKKPSVIITHSYQQTLWNETLKGGCEVNEAGILEFRDLFDTIRPNWIKNQPREMFKLKLDGVLDFKMFRTHHVPGGVQDWERAFWSNGLILDDKVVFTSDTRYDDDLFTDLNFDGIETIFHDSQLGGPGMVHATYEELQRVQPQYQQRMLLHHYGDNFAEFEPKADGFLGFSQPWVIYKFSAEPVVAAPFKFN